MPRDNLSRRFPLTPDLTQFLDMPPTRQAINAFVTAPCPDHWREIGTVYRVSNVFATSMGTSMRGHHYHAICGRHLAVGGDTALLASAYVQRDDVIDDPFVCVALGGRSLSDKSADYVAQDGRSMHDKSAEALQQVTGNDPRDLWRVWASNHDKSVQAVCTSLGAYWSNVLSEAYIDQRLHLTNGRAKGYLPLVSPKRAINWDLELEFSAAKETRHLIVLTAHQELTALYDWLVEWYERARTGVLPVNDEGLDEERLALLSIRARGYRYWRHGRTPASFATRGQRYDAPVEDLIPYCSLAALYWNFYKLYKQVYTEVVKPKRCEGRLADGSQCTHAVRLIEGPGHKPTFCPQCRPARKKDQGAERQRRLRKKRSEEGRSSWSVTPNNA